MAGEHYEQSIEENAVSYGYKTANLMYLSDVIMEFEASLEAAELHRLYGDIKAKVPSFQGVEASIIERHLSQYAPEWRNLFENFQNHFNSQADKSVLGEPAKKSLKELQEVIIESFTNHQISEELFNEFLLKNNLAPNDLVMVRSTGVHEDKADMANPGGNESLPAHANIAEISNALGRVAASYIGEKSLSQRLGAGDNTIAELPVMPGLVQRMINGDVYSGVLYTNDSSTRMQAAPGHGEYVVNSKGRVDNYYISPEDIVYSEVRAKDFRLQPQIEIGNNKVSLERVDNSVELKYESALSEPVVLYLNELGKFIEKKYGKRMDMEFVYSPENNTINIVQARAIPEGNRKGLAPSAVSPDLLGQNKSKLNIVDGLQVITPDVNRAAVVTNKDQVIVCNSIEEALSRYNAKGKDAGISSVIVQNPAPDTSHEAGVFNNAGIRVIQVKDITTFEKLLESEQPIIIDPQHSKIYEIPKELFNAESKTEKEIEQGLYDSKILSDGIYASPLTAYVTAIKHEFRAEGVRSVPVQTEGVLQDKTLGQLLAEAKAGDIKATEQLLSIAYEAMSFKDESLRGGEADAAISQNNTGLPQHQKVSRNDEIEDKAKKLRTNLEILTTPKIGHNNDELKVALGYNMRLVADAYKKGIINEDLFKQTIISGTEISTLLDKMTGQKGELTKEQKDKIFLEYFNSEKKFFGLTVGEGHSLATSLKAKEYEILAETLNPEITGDAKTYLVESLKLRDYLISDEPKQSWDKFCGKICANPENAAGLGSIVNKAVSFNANSQWINYIFADVNDPANPGATLAKLVKDFNNVDLDKSTKSLERSTQYLDSMKDAKGNDLQVVRFKDMITEFHGVMKIWIENNPSLTSEAENRINNIGNFLNSKANIQLTKNEFNPSANFAVNTATFTAPGTRPSRPNNLEDIFTLMHQNTIIATSNLGESFSKAIEKQYPTLVKELNKNFNSEIIREQRVVTPSTALELQNNTLTITKNLPLRNHSCIADIKYDIHNKTTSVSFSIFGHNELNRWDNVMLDNYLAFTLVGCKFINPPYFDKEKLVVIFEVKVENEKQIKAVIDEINKSIKTSFEVHGFTRNAELVAKNLLDQRIKILQENNNNPLFRNLKFIPAVDITWQEFTKLNIDFDEFHEFVKSKKKINELSEKDISFKEIIELSNNNYENIKFLLKQSNDLIYLFTNGFNTEGIKKITAGDFQNVKFLIDKSEKFCKLKSIGLSDKVMESWLGGKLENIKTLVDYRADIKILINQIDITTIDKWSEGKFENIIKLAENCLGIKGLISNKVSVNTIDKWSEGKFENITNLAWMSSDIEKLINSNINVNTIEKWSEGKFENIKFLITKANNVKTLSNNKEVWQELEDITIPSANSKKSNWDYTKFVIENSSQIIDLTNSGVGVKVFKEIYDKDKNLATAIIKNSKVVEANFLNKDNKLLTLEDLRKCKTEDIQNLANNKISAEQLKKDLAARPKVSDSSTVGKWATQVQQERQSSKADSNISKTI